MTEYEMVFAHQGHVWDLMHTMQKADQQELWSAARLNPRAALETAIGRSRNAMVGLADDKVKVMFGVAQEMWLSPFAVPWLLASEDIQDHGRRFLRESKKYFDGYKQQFPWLINFVDARHKRAIRWIKWLGFEVYPPAPFGFESRPFHRFEYRRDS
jgi:hypothetical protein